MRAITPNWIHAHVKRLFPKNHAVVLADGRQLIYDRLLLATGSQAAAGDFPGNDVQGIVTLYNMEDVRRILKLVRCSSTAVVIGGGIIALELAEGLAAHHVEVHYFLRGDRFWAKVSTRQNPGLVERGLQDVGI